MGMMKPFRQLVALAAAALSCVQADSGDGLIRIPLQRTRQSPHTVETAQSFRQQQQDRVRRRIASVASSNDSDDTITDPLSIGPLVFNEVPLGVGYGTHYAELYLGIPAQRASVIVDTGSHLTALPCSSCKGCGQHTDAYFDMAKSTTAKYMTCHEFAVCNTCSDDRCYISQAYTEGSMWQAVVVDEMVWLGGFGNANADAIIQNYGFRFPLGCQTKETGLFISQKENGIMGMGRHQTTIMAHMLSANRIERNIFSLCFGVAGGNFVLGGVDYSRHTTDVSYSPMLGDRTGWYPVHVKDIQVAGSSLGVDTSSLNSGKGVIVDSGTTDTFFVSGASRAFEKAFSSASGGVDYSNTKMKLSRQTFAALPNITIVLSGMKGDGSDDVELEIPPQKYLTPLDNKGVYYYGNIHFSERSGGVIGASVMIGYDVVFDTDNNRVGFAEASCDTSPNAPQIVGDDEPTSEANNSSSIEPSEFSKNDTDSSIAAANLAYVGFLAEVAAVSLVGVLVVVVIWKRVKKRSWVAIPDAESVRGSLSVLADTVDDETPSGSARVLSPRRDDESSSGGARNVRSLSPRFTIGSDDESPSPIV